MGRKGDIQNIICLVNEAGPQCKTFTSYLCRQYKISQIKQQRSVLRETCGLIWCNGLNHFEEGSQRYGLQSLRAKIIPLTIPHTHTPPQPTPSVLNILEVWSVCDLNRTPLVMAKHGGPCVHFSWISTCGRTSRETVSHPQRPPLPTLYKISLPVCVVVANKRLQPLTTTW